MSTKASKTIKVNAVKVVPAIVKEEIKAVQTDKLNMSELISSLSNVSIKEKNSLSRKGLYRYSADELIEIEKDKDVSKKIRNRARRSTDNFLFEIGLKIKNNQLADATSVGHKFIEYYKERFLLNDFSLDSVRESSSLSDTVKIIYTVALKFCSAL